MEFMPLFVDMKGKRALVVGGGRIACRKIKTLLGYGASVEVVTLEVVCSEIEELGIPIHLRPFEERDLKERFLVAAATDNRGLNSYIVGLCNERNILVNNMTTKTDLNCRFAANTATDEYQVAVSAKGFPIKAKTLLKEIEEFMGKGGE